MTVELSANVAASAAARVWQAGQRIEKLSGGRVAMTFSVSDVAEVARWSLGFGSDARITAPPAAVEQARATVAKIADGYASR